MARQNVAEQFVDILARAGVRRMYGVVGDSLNPVVDAIRRNRAVDWIQVRHEEVAACGSTPRPSSPALSRPAPDPAARATSI